MRTTIRRHPSVSRSLVPKCALGLCPLVLAGLLAAGWLQAQTPATPPAPAAKHNTTHRHSRSARAHKSAKAAQTPPAQTTPAEPPKPNWPVNDQPAPATITWDSKGLCIQAANSSLQQILEDVATATGAKVEGTVTDQRVFGIYGPGQAREVLLQLLQGSGYNVLMIGGQGHGAPSRIVLTARSAGGVQTPARGVMPDEGDDAEPQAEEPPQPPVAPPIVRPGFGSGPIPGPLQPMPIMRQMQQMQQMQQRYSQPNQ